LCLVPPTPDPRTRPPPLPSPCSLNPYAEWMYDGINLSPFEVMFIKVCEGVGWS
jgi:hypothetical protein